MQLVEAAIKLFNRVFSRNEDLAHRLDYDWLYNPVMEVCVCVRRGEYVCGVDVICVMYLCVDGFTATMRKSRILSKIVVLG